MRRFFFFALLLSTCGMLAHGQKACRHYLADQHSGQSGFYLDFENKPAAGDSQCRLDNLSLIFGVGNGTRYVYLSQHGNWELNREYVAVGNVANGVSILTLNGNTVGSAAAELTPAEGLIYGGTIPSFANNTAEYIAVLEDVQLQTNTGKSLNLSFAKEASRPLPLYDFDPSGPRQSNWDLAAGEALSITVRFRLIATPPLAQYAPYVDRYGQSDYGNWPGKFHNDEQFAQAAAKEQGLMRRWGSVQQFDVYGGYVDSGWKEPATGFFLVMQKNGFWWLISPLGNPCFYTSFDSAPGPTLNVTPVTGRESLFAELPPRDGESAEAWRTGVNGDPGVDYFVFSTANLIRKYGPDWRNRLNEITKQRAQAWGFSGLGKFSDEVGLSYIPRLSRKAFGNTVGAKHPDIFDPQVQEAFRTHLKPQMLDRAGDPFLVGWSLGNEAEELIAGTEIIGIFAKADEQTPIKRALVDHALQQLYGGNLSRLAAAWKVPASSIEDVYASKTAVLPPADIESLRQYYAGSYYKFIYTTVRQIDPQHLYLGFFIQIGGFSTLADWTLLGENCDVIGYDRYAYGLTDDRVNEWLRATNKAALLGEFSFSPTYNMQRGFGAAPNSPSEDERMEGTLYGQVLREAATNPYIVGTGWFAYRDQAITGRGPGSGPDLTYGEHTARGLIDVTDTPKWAFIDLVRRENLAIAPNRLANTLR